MQSTSFLLLLVAGASVVLQSDAATLAGELPVGNNLNLSAVNEFLHDHIKVSSVQKTPEILQNIEVTVPGEIQVNRHSDDESSQNGNGKKRDGCKTVTFQREVKGDSSFSSIQLQRPHGQHLYPNIPGPEFRTYSNTFKTKNGAGLEDARYDPGSGSYYAVRMTAGDNSRAPSRRHVADGLELKRTQIKSAPDGGYKQNLKLYPDGSYSQSTEIKANTNVRNFEQSYP